MTSISDYAYKFIGVKQGTPRHKLIINAYNSEIKPLPRSYKVKYTDNWCATFVSLCLKRCGCSQNYYECSAHRMMQKFKKAGKILKSKTEGKKDDIIFYDWDGKGWIDHVGIIYQVTKTQYKVIEGNKSRAVGMRAISKNSKYISCIARL